MLKYDFVLFPIVAKSSVTYAYHNVIHTSPSSDPNQRETHPLKLLLHVKWNTRPFVPCLSSCIHPSQLFQWCLSNASACRALPPPDWFFSCVHLCAGNASLTVYKPEDLCPALEFFLRFYHLLKVLFCLSSKFWIVFSQYFFFLLFKIFFFLSPFH